MWLCASVWRSRPHCSLCRRSSAETCCGKPSGTWPQSERNGKIMTLKISTDTRGENEGSHVVKQICDGKEGTQCGDNFSLIPNLNLNRNSLEENHVKTACAGKPSYSSCLITGTSDVTLDTSHMDRSHINVVCSVLENMKEITMERNLSEHNICDEAFSTRYFQVDETRENLKYKACGIASSDLSVLLAHVITHPGDGLHKCKENEEASISPSSFKIHERSHIGKKLHECKQCGKTYRHHSSLQTHERSHSGEKPYECKTCRKVFTCLSYLRKHEQMHTRKKPCECKQCGKAFKLQFPRSAQSESHRRETLWN